MARSISMLRLSNRIWVVSLLGIGIASGCGPDHEFFQEPVSGTGGAISFLGFAGMAGGFGFGGAAPGPQPAESGTATAGTSVQGGGPGDEDPEPLGLGMAGRAAIQGGPCALDEECAPGGVCFQSAGYCVACSEAVALTCAEVCADGAPPTQILANGCLKCACDAPVLSPCDNHLDCGVGERCDPSGLCVDCTGVEPRDCQQICPVGFERASLEINGCTTCDCVPTNECSSDDDCPTGEVCYAGQHCEPGCLDSSCCQGNVCSAPGCAGTESVDCAVFGCTAGASCSVLLETETCDYQAQECDCVAGAWSCSLATCEHACE